MDIREYLNSRRGDDARKSELLRSAKAEREEAFASMAAATGELDEMIVAARDGLVAVPTQGSAWNAETRYMAGDTVEGGYVALRYNRGKEPSQYLGVYWEIQEDEVIEWESIEDGTILYEGGVVSYDGVIWICTSQHMKSTVYKPKDGSSKWERHGV